MNDKGITAVTWFKLNRKILGLPNNEQKCWITIGMVASTPVLEL